MPQIPKRRVAAASEETDGTGASHDDNECDEGTQDRAAAKAAQKTSAARAIRGTVRAVVLPPLPAVVAPVENDAPPAVRRRVIPEKLFNDVPQTFRKRRMDELTRNGLRVVFAVEDLPELSNDRDSLRCRLASVATTEKTAKNMVSAEIGRHNYEATLKPMKSNPDKNTCKVSTSSWD